MNKKSLINTAIIFVLTFKLSSQNNTTMKNINQNAPVKCNKTILINSNAQRVWDVMTNINNWASWQTDISNPSLSGKAEVNNTFVWKTGGAKIHSTLHTVDPNQNFGWTGKTYGMFAIHNWRLVEKDGQTQVSVDESMEGFFAKLFKKSFNRNLERDMMHWLELLKKESEKG